MPLLTPDQLALLSLAAEGRKESQYSLDKIVPYTGVRDAPLTSDQHRLWFLDQLDPGSSTYNDCIAVEFRGGEVEHSLLEKSLQLVVQRQAALRTSFHDIQGAPVQRIHPAVLAPLVNHDLRGLEPLEQTRRLHEILHEDVGTAFSLERPPMLRASLIQTEDCEYTFAVTMHHIISDGTSYGVFYEEMSHFYEALQSGDANLYGQIDCGLEELPIQYTDFARWQRAWENDPASKAGLEYWKSKFAPAPSPLIIATDGSQPSSVSDKGVAAFFTLDRGAYDSLQTYCGKENVTENWVLLAVFSVLIGIHTDREDFLVGIPSSTRDRVEVEGLIGLFVHTLAMRADLSGDPTFRELVGRARAESLAVHAHQDVPFEQIAPLIESGGSRQGGSALSTFFCHMNEMLHPMSIQGIESSHRFVDGGHSRFDLTLIVEETGTNLSCWFEYRSDLLSSRTVSNLITLYTSLLRFVVARPRARLSELKAAMGEIAKTSRIAQSSTSRGSKPTPLRKLSRNNRRAGADGDEAPQQEQGHERH